MKLTISLFSLLLSTLAPLSATTVYSETFTDQEGKGYNGSSTGDFTGVDWTIAGSAAGITATSDWFTVDGGQISIRDIDGDLTWTSPSIDISSVSEPLEISIDLGANGDFEIDGDVFTVSYQIDLNAPVPVFQGVVDEDAPGDPFFIGTTQLTSALTSFTAGISGTGSSLVITVDANNNAGTEFMFFDNVTVSAVPEPAAALLGSFGLLGLLRRRR